MGAYKKFHGITLANNSWVENFHVERLAADPSVTYAGRTWYNTADKMFKLSTLNEVGSVIIQSFATVEAFTAAIATLDTELRAHIATEISGIQTQVDALGNAFNYVGALPGQTGVTGTGTDVDPYILDAMEPGFKDAGDYYKVTTAGFYKFGSNDAIEAQLNDGIVFNTSGGLDRINNQQSSVDGTADEVVVVGTVETGFTVSLAQAIKDTIAANTAAVTAETTRAQAAEGDLATLSTTAKGNLVAAINELKGVNDSQQSAIGISTANITALGNVVNAVEAGAGLDSNGNYVGRTGTNYLDTATSLAEESGLLDNALAAEVARAKSAEGTLSTLTTTDKTSLVNAINEVAAAAGDATALNAAQTEIDAIEAGAGLGTDGTYQARTGSNFLDTATSLADESTKLDAALYQEVQDRNGHVQSAIDFTQSVSNALGQEATDRVNADNALDLRITQESTARNNGDAELDAKIAEMAALAGITGDLGGTGGDLNNLTTADKTSLVNALNEVNAGVYTLEKRSVQDYYDATVGGNAPGDLIEGATAHWSFFGPLAAGDRVIVNDGQWHIYTVEAGGAAPTLTETMPADGAWVVSIEKAGKVLTQQRNGVALGSISLGSSMAFDHYLVDGRRVSTAISSLETDRGDLASLTTTAKSNLVAAINEVAAAAGEGTGALKTAIDAQIKIYNSFGTTGASTVHIFNHGLVNKDITAEVWFRTEVVETYNDLGTMTVADANALISAGTIAAGDMFTVSDAGNLLLGPTAVVANDVVYVTAYSYNEGAYTGAVTTTAPTKVVWVNDSAPTHIDETAGTVSVYCDEAEEVKIIVRDLTALSA